MNNKSFNQWFPECEADLRDQTQRLYRKYQGWRLGIDSGDLFNDVVVKLTERNHPVNHRDELFGLVSKVALNIMRDLGRKKSIRDKFFSSPMPARLRPQPGSSIETVASREPSPFEQAALSDQVEMIGKAASQDRQLKELFQTLVELTGRDESTSSAHVARHLQLPYKRVINSLGKLRSIVRKMI